MFTRLHASGLRGQNFLLHICENCFKPGQVASLNLAVASATLPGFLSGWCRSACCS